MEQQSTQPIRKPAGVSTFACEPCVPSLSSSLQALTTTSEHVAEPDSETRAHELCRMCRANVFDAKTIRAIYDQTYGHKTEGVFNKSMDALAFYGNRSYISNLHRKFTYRICQVDEGVKNGCILCSLLNEAQEGQEPSFSSSTSQGDHDEQRVVTVDQASRSFHFSLNLRPAWEWSTIEIEYPDVSHKSTHVQLRTYPVDSRFAQPGVTSTHLPNHGVHSQDVNAANTGARHWAQSFSRSIRVLRTFIDECLGEHPLRSQQSEGPLPSMLLHVSGPAESLSVRLLSVPEIPVRPLRYVCLSYCWGGPQPQMTTRARLATYLQDIDTKTLPATIFDAIITTRSLGFEYLWTDSLCIVQDSAQSKSVELAKMASIYAGGVCTICAMSSQAASEGFLEANGCSESGTVTRNFRIEDVDSHRTVILERQSDLRERNLFEEPLLSRAWTLQESLLSPRVLMFFAGGQPPSFRCCQHPIRADGGVIARFSKSLSSIDTTWTAFAESKDTDSYKVQDEWCDTVSEYTQRSLAFSEDKLPALSGIVATYADRVDLGTYHAGLWSKSILIDLMWRVPRFISPRKAYDSYVAPSWSWASRSHRVRYNARGSESSDDLCSRFIACDIALLDPALPFGAVKSASLTLECIAEEVKMSSIKKNVSSSAQVLGGLYLANVRGYSATFVFDDDPIPEGLDKVWMLIIGSEEPYNNAHDIGLGVVEVHPQPENHEKAYRRIGMFYNGQTSSLPRGTPMQRFTLV